ncbi:haloacid dehalogenase-like hydrolase [Ancylostoma ceylanicum]|uniref:Haloacid dehalogenase-like hydrolase n=2 Tax=Ancylostoma ceylanicum TaxID=53326 RepID=A0A0D6LX48_9BILA|nr:haloacid dehalogenase-like hydrolase [Ancylostoma ceylanicum]EYC14483.1 hypothetical protein Y032_0040g233 [Ancylostoma ceylanicum]
MTADNGVKLVIFDKDGTLVDFHRMWLPWAANTVKLLEQATGRPVGPAVYKTLGVDPIQGKVSMGALAEKTLTGIRADVSATLQTFGISATDADRIVERGVPEAANGVTAPVCDLPKLFRELRALGCKTALCTADSRTATEEQMRVLGISSMLDEVVCGNDVGIIPKPSPHCAIQICKRVGVPLNQAIMVGDTVADLKMGRVAGLRASVGVLTGVGTRESLKEYTDYFLDNVSELPWLIATKINENTKRG